MKRASTILRMVSVLLGAAPLVAFILTEDLSTGPLLWVNENTPLIGGIMAGFVVAAAAYIIMNEGSKRRSL